MGRMTRRLCRKVVVCVDKGQVMSFVLRTGNFAVVDCILWKWVDWIKRELFKLQMNYLHCEKKVNCLIKGRKQISCWKNQRTWWLQTIIFSKIREKKKTYPMTCLEPLKNLGLERFSSPCCCPRRFRNYSTRRWVVGRTWAGGDPSGDGRPKWVVVSKFIT